MCQIDFTFFFFFEVLAAKLHTTLINTGAWVRLSYSFSTRIFTSYTYIQHNISWTYER